MNFFSYGYLVFNVLFVATLYLKSTENWVMNIQCLPDSRYVNKSKDYKSNVWVILLLVINHSSCRWGFFCGFFFVCLFASFFFVLLFYYLFRLS